MKTLIFSLCLTTLFQTSIFSQCVQCDDLTEALKSPLDVKSLDLSHEKLKIIPREIEKLSALEELDLSYNSIENITLDLNKLPLLQIINFSNNRSLDLFTTSDNFFSSNLKSLNFSNCNLFFVPENFSHLKALESLDLSNNLLSFLPQSFGDLGRLKNLNLSSNNLKSDNFFLGQLWELEELNLADNPKCNLENIFISLQNKKNLQELTITQTASNKPFGALDNLYIKKLVLKNSSVDFINPNLTKLKNLNEITFDNTNFVNPNEVYKTLNEISQLSKLTFINSSVGGDLKKITAKNQLVFIDAQVENNQEVIKRDNVQFVNSTDFDSIAIKQNLDENPLIAFSEKMLKNEVEEVVDVKVEKTQIQADTPCKITLENTLFDIPKNAFLDKNNQVYSGKVNIEVKEYFDPISVALAGVPMIMNESGTPELFSSSGMFEFSAFDDKGNKLNPNPDNVIQVEMKNTQVDQNSDLFSYNDSLKNWERLQNNMNPVSPILSQNRNTILDSLNALPDSLFAQLNIVHVPFTLSYFDARKKRQKFQLAREYSLNLHHAKTDVYPTNKRMFFKNQTTTYLSNDKGLKYLSNAYLLIDSLVYPEHKALMDLIKADTFNVKLYLNDRIYKFNPRNFTKISVCPDFEKDHFKFQFEFQGKEFSVPLIINKDRNLKNYQKKNYDFYKQYLKYEKQNEEELKKVREHFEKNHKAIADMNRVLRARQLQSNLFNGNQLLYKEQLRFGMTKFGLVNCDYYWRNPPSRYIAFSDSMIDQNDEKTPVPSSIRIIVPSDKTYLVSNSSNVPQFGIKKTVLFFVVSSVEIAVIKSWKKLKNGFFVPMVKRISIIGLSEEEIRKQILN